MPLDPRKLELLDSLSANFNGASLLFIYLTAKISYRPHFSAFLSDKFFGRFFGNFEVVKFWGDSLPIKEVPIAEQPLLRLPGLMRNKRQLLFECQMADHMFEVDEIVDWLHYTDDTNKGKERILFINGLAFPVTLEGIDYPSQPNQWTENLAKELKKCLLCASKPKAYELYIDWQCYDYVGRRKIAIPPAEVLAKNYATSEQLTYEVRQDMLPMGTEFGNIQQFQPRNLFRVFRRTKMFDDSK